MILCVTVEDTDRGHRDYKQGMVVKWTVFLNSGEATSRDSLNNRSEIKFIDRFCMATLSKLLDVVKLFVHHAVLF